MADSNDDRKRVLVLGGGMVGAVMADDLARDDGLAVTLADLREESLERARARNPRVHGVRADLSDPAEVHRLASEQDLVCGALASHLAFSALRAVVDAGRPYADIAFMPEDAWELDDLAREAGVTCVVDCGVAPGLSNLLVGHGVSTLDRCDSARIYVGGLPRERRLPFEYKAGFAPADVIEEYTRPSRVVEDGRVVVKEALAEVEHVDVDGVGTLEAFLTDGLRSLAASMDVPHMVEKTMRYPGHAALMAAFREAGLFSKDEVEVDGARVRPLDVTSAVLFPRWTYEDGEEDLTVLRVVTEGEAGGRRVRMTWDLLDRYSREERATSMSRTTALPCAIVARMLARGEHVHPGVHAPELLGRDAGKTEAILSELRSRGVDVRARREDLGPA